MRKQVTFALILIIIIVISLYFKEYMTIEVIKANKFLIQSYISNHYVFIIFLFVLSCIIFINSPIPLAAIIKTLGGYLFGFKIGIILNVISTTIACTLSFYASRYLLKDLMKDKYKKLNKEINENGFLYVFSLRIMLIVPYFIINIVSGISKIKSKDYILATFLGVIIPSIIYAHLGQSLEQVNTLQDLLSIEIFIALGLVGFLSLIPLLVKHFKKHVIKK